MLVEKLTAQQKKLNTLVSVLPELCEPFLLETGTEMTITTRIAYANELRWFFEYLINYSPIFCEYSLKDFSLEDLKKITSQDVSRYLSINKDNGRKERTVARKRSSISCFFNYMVDNRYVEYNPVNAAVKVKIHKSDTVTFLDFKEQNKLLETVNTGSGLDEKKKKYHERYKNRDLALITLFLDTGMRVSELNGINVGDVDLQYCYVNIIRKGGDSQRLYFSDEVSELIDQYLCERQEKYPITLSDPLFVTNKGTRLSIRAIEVLVKKYTSASIPGIGNKLSPHKLRSSFAMGYYGAVNKDILALQKALGHKSLAATNVYAKATDQQMADNREVMSNLRNLADSRTD